MTEETVINKREYLQAISDGAKEAINSEYLRDIQDAISHGVQEAIKELVREGLIKINNK